MKNIKIKKNLATNKNGFTLIETLITVGIFILAAGAASALIIMLYRSQAYSWQQSVAIDEARRGIETMVKEIRETRDGEDGSYPIEKAEDKEFIFYSDIDNDGKTERIRYFLGTVGSGNQTEECQTLSKGGTCSVSFSNFLTGALTSAQVKISAQGDLGWNNKEYVESYADGIKLGDICKTGCSDCPGVWEGTQTYAITNQAQDNNIQFLADARNDVDPQCPFAMKTKFEFSFTEDLSTFAHEFKKGVIRPTGDPLTYPSDQEQMSTLTFYVRNTPPIFEYFNAEGEKIDALPARLTDTKLMKLHLIVNVNPDRPPENFELESSVQLRNLKDE